MLYGDIYSVPENTPANNPSSRKVVVTKGTIAQWIVYGPDEKANLLHVRVLYQKHQILPCGDLMWMYPLDIGAPISENLLLEDPPYELEIEAYNDDDSYPHEYIVLMNIKPFEAVTEAVTQPGLVNRIQDFFSGLAGVFFGVF